MEEKRKNKVKEKNKFLKNENKNNLKKKIKNVFNDKTNIILLIVALIIIIVCVVVKVIYSNRSKYKLDEIYDLYPVEVRELYANKVDVSCYGGLNFDIKLGKTEVDKISKKVLLDYMFSNIDKNTKLHNKMDISEIKKIEKSLFNKKIDLISSIKDYQYNNYVYNIKDGKLLRTKKECVSDIRYVTHLYGYFNDKNTLFMDVSIGYWKDGILYDFNDKNLGEYDGRISTLLELMKGNPYYRLYYKKSGGKYKLDSVEFKKVS